MFRTILDLRVVMPMQYRERPDKRGFNRIMVSSLGQKNLENHFLTVATEAKENSIESMFKTMYKSDFVEPKLQNNSGKFSLNYNLLSKNERAFLDLGKMKQFDVM